MNIRFLSLLVGSFFITSAWSESLLTYPEDLKFSPNPGATDFDATDRLAITNLLGAMIYAIDSSNVDLLISTLAEEYTIEYQVPGSAIVNVTGRDAFKKMITQRFVNLKKDGMRRRHIVTPPFFMEQTADTAHIVIHILNCTMVDQKNWHPFMSAISIFRVVKRNGCWAFISQIEITDIPMDVPLDKLLPVSAPASK